MTTIALLPGDGIGAEILEGPVAFLKELAAEGLPITLTEPLPYGTTGWIETGSLLPPVTVEACKSSDVILSGAVGTHPGVSAAECPQPEAALGGLRHMFDLRLSIRTVWAPGRDEMTIVRNIVGGAYLGPDHRIESDGTTEAVDEIRLSPVRIREVLETAADFAALVPGRRYLSVDKQSVFATSRLWRRVATQVAEERGVSFEHLYVDRAAYELARGDRFPAVLATEGIFGDILSDIASACAGSPALCGSATVS
ncbi:isocitrate/isopropylmalate family dehydrogenase, partial [Streptomyces sp. NPDC001939]